MTICLISAVKKKYSGSSFQEIANYWMRPSMIIKNYADLEGICIILHIIRKPNSIIVLLFIHNISKSTKNTNCIKKVTLFGVEFSLTVAGFWMFLS